MFYEVQRVNTLFFSPTGTTKKVVNTISRVMSDYFNTDIYNKDFTLPDVREETISFNSNELTVVAVPVYAGRVPNVLLKYLNSIRGNGGLAVAVVVYGNRNYDDALVELKDILEEDGFNVIAGVAFVGEHSFSKILAKNRPDDIDLEKAKEFSKEICEKIKSENLINPLTVKGNKPYRSYYKPEDKFGNPVDIRKVKPKTNNNCIDCKLCVKVCPMGSIDYNDVSQFTGICIKCGACIKTCPVEAKYYDDYSYLKHKEELEEEFTYRREPELFL